MEAAPRLHGLIKGGNWSGFENAVVKTSVEELDTPDHDQIYMPYHYIQRGPLSTVQLLVERKADLNVVNGRVGTGWSTLARAG